MGLLPDSKEIEKDIVEPAIVKLDAETIPALFAQLAQLITSLNGWTLVIKEITIELHAPKINGS
jgi:hypothetical protein